jgi:tetratricopeptide (TPR) repeat protein
LAWLVAGAGAGLFSSWVEQHFLGAKGADFDLPLLERGLVAGRAVFFYLQKVIWPFGLNFVYPRWTPDAAVWWQWLFPLGVIALAGALWFHRHRSRAPLAAFLLFIGSLFPVLGFVNLYGGLYSFVWDHWQYLPDLGPIALVAAGLVRVRDRLAPPWRTFGPAFAGLLVLLLGALSRAHIPMFHDNETLYRTTFARNPGAWMAHFNLGGMLIKDPDRTAEGIAEFEAALRINPGLADAHYSLGTVLAKIPGREPEAVTHFEASLRLDPRVAAVHYNYANLLVKFPGRKPEAVAQYREALRLDPGLAEAHYNLGLALLGDEASLPEAVAQFEAALRLRPDFPLAREIVDRWHAAQP